LRRQGKAALTTLLWCQGPGVKRIVTAVTSHWARLSLIASAAGAVAFKALSDFDFTTIAGGQASIGQVWLDALAFILQRDRYYLTPYSALGAVALAATLIAFYLFLVRRMDPDWALSLTLAGAMATPLAISLVAAVRLVLSA
jgi:hypothetical protein